MEDGEGGLLREEEGYTHRDRAGRPRAVWRERGRRQDPGEPPGFPLTC